MLFKEIVKIWDEWAIESSDLSSGCWTSMAQLELAEELDQITS
jgi:hypothetical protein